MIIDKEEWEEIKKEQEKMKYGEIKIIVANEGRMVDIIISNRKRVENEK